MLSMAYETVLERQFLDYRLSERSWVPTRFSYSAKIIKLIREDAPGHFSANSGISNSSALSFVAFQPPPGMH